MASVTAVVFVDDKNLRGLVTSRGGDANKWVNRVARDIKDAAVRKAPVGPPRLGTPHRTANLKRSHFNTGVLWRGRGIRAEGSIVNNAPYARYVHEGVPGFIVPRPKFVIPKSSFLYYVGNSTIASRAGGKGTHMRWTNPVRGQKANPWLALAAARVVARTGA
jgi:hypothetical protein